MLKKINTVVALIVAVCMLTTVGAMASEFINSDNLVSKEAAVLSETDGSFKVELKIPGVDGSNLHDEVILMVDGSYSGDSEWPLMKDAIMNVGRNVLNGSGNTQLTLMAFGMGDNEVLTHVESVEELGEALGALPGNLLYGRSSTNCESGFTGVGEYIENHDDTLNKAYVLYISDGEVNTDETPYTFFNWKENTWLRWSADTIIAANFDAECGAIDQGADRSEAFIEVFGADSDLYTVATTATSEQLAMWSDLVWTTVYEYSNLDPETEYPVSVVERAFVKYDNEHNTYLQDNFYYALVGRSYPNKGARTMAAAAELAVNPKIEELYIIDNNSSTAWMQGIEGTEFVPAGSIAGLVDAMEGTLANLAKTPFNDIVVTDYMSKWVNLDTSSISVIDDATGEAIYTVADGWLIPEEERPTAKESPIEIELVSAEDYAKGGAETAGNTSGDIYKLIWTVKDGAILRSESYHLEYIVMADEEEAGFSHGNVYSTNGYTAVAYMDEGGVSQVNEIAVPQMTLAEEEEEKTAELSFSKASYAYIFGYEPVIKKVENEDGTTETEVSIQMAMDDYVTIEQVCTMITRAIDQEFNCADVHYEGTEKTDAYADKWYYRGVSYLDSLGAFENGDAVVGPATRGQVAKLIAYGLKIDSTADGAAFDDIAGNEYEEYILAVAARGYMQGIGNNEFAPDKIMTRGEFCALFNNILGKTGNSLVALGDDGEEYEVTSEIYHFVDMSPTHWAYDDCLIATSAYFENGYVDMETRLENIRNKIDQFDDQKEY